jgi:hypothetical protein
MSATMDEKKKDDFALMIRICYRLYIHSVPEIMRFTVRDFDSESWEMAEGRPFCHKPDQ